MFEVRASYKMDGQFADSRPGYGERMDSAATAAAGRQSDFSGAGFGERDLGWNCDSEIEAHRIATALGRVGLAARVVSVSRH